MPISFVRLAGAAGDLKEIEYVSALMQTDIKVRKDGSILPEDLRLFLKSRYGIEVSESELRHRVYGSLAGPGAEKESIDVMDMLTLLFIPTLLKSSLSSDSEDGSLPDDLVAPKQGLLQYVLSMILHDTTGNHAPKRLNKQLLQRILVSYGEPDLALDDKLLDEMMEAAHTADGKLTLEAFSKALTGDVQLYDIASETRLTTNYDDVFLTQNHRDPSEWRRKQEDTNNTDIETAASTQHSTPMAVERKRSLAHKLKERTTGANIDMIAGSYRSKSLTVLLWATFCVSYYGYYAGTEFENDCEEYVYAGSFSTNADALLCRSTYSIGRWLVLFVAFSVFGLLFIGVGSIGNDVHCRRWYVPLIGAIGIFVSIVAVGIDPVVGANGGLDRKEYRIFSVTAVVLGFLAILLHISHSITILIPDRWLRRVPRFYWLLEKQNIRGEVHTKKAAANKLDKVVCNALSITVPQADQRDRVTETHFGNALHAFAKYGQQYEAVGGFLWTWKRVWSNELFFDDGIWLSARLIASNVAQFVVVLFVFLAGISFTRTVMEHYEQETAKEWAGEYVDYLFNTSINSSLVGNAAANVSHVLFDFLNNNPTLLNDTCASYAENLTVDDACKLVGDYYQCDSGASSNYLCAVATYSGDDSGEHVTSLEDGMLQLGLLNASGLDSAALSNTAQSAMQSAADEAIDSLYPTEARMVQVPTIVGVIVATITALSLAVTYLPSTVTTTLKLRCGMIPSLRDAKFSKYRVAVDTVTLLTGSLFWGCLIASLMVGGIVGFVIFFFMWQATTVFAQQLVAVLIGILTVVALKWVLVQCCRLPTYKSFYRKRPAAANIWNLALECANFALSVGFISARLIKLVFTAALYVGRVDVPFLAQGVGELGGLQLDGYPTIFLRDVLAHEAHRHPYIELLGVLYLMHLRYDEHFGSRAGATWRLLFVYALMPWTNVYRILPNSEEEEEDAENENNVEEGAPRSAIDFVSLRNVFDDLEGSSLDFDMDTKPPSNLLVGRERSAGTAGHKEVHFQPPEIPPPATLMKRATSGLDAKHLSNRMSHRSLLDQSSELFPPAALMKRAGSSAFLVQRGISKRHSMLTQELNDARVQELEEKNLELTRELQSLKLQLAQFEVANDDNGASDEANAGSANTGRR